MSELTFQREEHVLFSTEQNVDLDVSQFISQRSSKSVTATPRLYVAGTELGEMIQLIYVYPYSGDTDPDSDRATGPDDAQRFEKPSEALFEEIAEKSPSRLVSMIQSGELGPVDMFFAAKAASRATREIIEPALLVLLKHQSPLVREGAVYGLSSSCAPEIQRALRHVAANDESHGVREAAEDFFESV